MSSRIRSTFARALAAGGVIAIALSGCAGGVDEADSAGDGPGADASMEADMLTAPAASAITALDIDEIAGVVRIATASGVLEAALPVAPADDEAEAAEGEAPEADAPEGDAVEESTAPVAPQLLGDRVDQVKSYERLGTRILVSGHPVDDSAEDHLGLWEADVETGEWQPLALTGEVDFHAMASAGVTPADGVLAAADAVTGSIFYSPDGGASWQTGAELESTSLAFTADASVLLAVTPDGLQASTDRGQTFAAVEDAPELTLLATPPVGSKTWRIVGVTATGELWRSTDGLTWEQVGELPFAPVALAIGATEGAVYAATEDAVSVTTDGGVTLSPIVELAP